MLKLTKKSDYGLIALRHLAAEPRRSAATAKEIAEVYKIPVPILAKVLQALVRNRFLISEQGATGGYKLARDPRTISTLEVIRAIDGPVFLASCFHDQEVCDQHDTCTVKEPLRKVHEGIQRLLASISISDLSSDVMEIPEPAARRDPREDMVWPIQKAKAESTESANTL
ncbi:MAG: Rrf2 family transcriptional regulator [Bryobacteraceae bacterium]